MALAYLCDDAGWAAKLRLVVFCANAACIKARQSKFVLGLRQPELVALVQANGVLQSQSCFARLLVSYRPLAPSRTCRGARFWGDTHRREPAVAFLFEFVAELQGLPLFLVLLGAAKGCHLLSYSGSSRAAESLRIGPQAQRPHSRLQAATNPHRETAARR